jgi:hypothetical protein
MNSSSRLPARSPSDPLCGIDDRSVTTVPVAARPYAEDTRNAAPANHTRQSRAAFCGKKLEAPPGFEPGMEVLQTSALPLGDGAAGSRSVTTERTA